MRQWEDQSGMSLEDILVVAREIAEKCDREPRKMYVYASQVRPIEIGYEKLGVRSPWPHRLSWEGKMRIARAVLGRA